MTVIIIPQETFNGLFTVRIFPLADLSGTVLLRFHRQISLDLGMPEEQSFSPYLSQHFHKPNLV